MSTILDEMQARTDELEQALDMYQTMRCPTCIYGAMCSVLAEAKRVFAVQAETYGCMAHLTKEQHKALYKGAVQA